jgi:hypothetical protein
MAHAGDVTISVGGQITLSEETRHRWGLEQGGVVGWVDLGDAVLLVPGGASEFRKAFLAGADWDAARTGFGDPDLANQ